MTIISRSLGWKLESDEAVQWMPWRTSCFPMASVGDSKGDRKDQKRSSSHSGRFHHTQESFRDVSTALKMTPIQVNKIDRQTLMVFKVNVLLMCQDKHDVYPPEKTKPKPKLEQESGLWPIFCWTSPNGPSSILDGWFFGIHVQFWSHSPARLTFCGKVIAPWRAGRKKVWLSLDDPSWYTQFEKYALVKIGNLPPKKRCKHPEIKNISSEMSVHFCGIPLLTLLSQTQPERKKSGSH